jgi:ribonuclease D
VRTAPPAAKRPEPWRRTGGSHAVRDQHGLAVLRALWQAREELAQEIDVAPGRVLVDRAIVAAAVAQPHSLDALRRVRGFGTGAGLRRSTYWWRAVESARRLSRADLPATRGPRHPGPPPARTWRSRNPQAAARLSQARAAVAAISQARAIPPENLLAPDTLRAAIWDTPADVDAFLDLAGARPWQVETVGPIIAQANADHPDEVTTAAATDGRKD